MCEYFNDIWCLYFHDPYSMEWNIENYKLISTLSNVEDFINTYIKFKDIFSKGMFFIMREHILPVWEDENNKNGGCLSYKLYKGNVEEGWFDICSLVMGETLGTSNTISKNINGISICPKKNYYIVRIWIKDNKLANKELYNINIPKFSTIMYKNHLN